jgi:predicted glycosyltransferase
MQTYLFIGGTQDCLNIPLAPDVDVVQLPAIVTGKDNYLAAKLAVDDVSITVYRHESLTSEQVLNCLVEHYKAWAVNRPGGRR